MTIAALPSFGNTSLANGLKPSPAASGTGLQTAREAAASGFAEARSPFAARHDAKARHASHTQQTAAASAGTAADGQDGSATGTAPEAASGTPYEQASIHAAIAGINAQIEAFNATDWQQQPDGEPDVVMATKLNALSRFQAIEQAAIAQAAHAGVSGTGFSFAPLDMSVPQPPRRDFYV